MLRPSDISPGCQPFHNHDQPPSAALAGAAESAIYSGAPARPEDLFASSDFKANNITRDHTGQAGVEGGYKFPRKVCK
jgi:hypothetical protein